MTPSEDNVILKCIAVDDEPFALKLIEDDISKVQFLKLLKTFTSPAEALSFSEKGTGGSYFSRCADASVTGERFYSTTSKSPVGYFYNGL
jgi:hypothetical protein